MTIRAVAGEDRRGGVSEAIFEVRAVIISPCDKPSCPRWATCEISLLGASTWAFQRVCGYHKRWAKARCVVASDDEQGGEGRG